MSKGRTSLGKNYVACAVPNFYGVVKFLDLGPNMLGRKWFCLPLLKTESRLAFDIGAIQLRHKVRLLISAIAFTLSACGKPVHIPALNIEAPPPQKKIEDAPVNYQTLRDYILEPHCSTCHSPDSPSPANSILFAPYQTLAGATPARWESPAESSRIIRTLTRTDKFRMPPPTAGDGLSESEIDFVVKWIDAGKPEF